MSFEFNLNLYAYCGMRVPLIEGGTLAECRKRAATRIRVHRDPIGYPVSILKRGCEWEMQSDPDGASMVSDYEGIMKITKRRVR